jgi:hypothetical protein
MLVRALVLLATLAASTVRSLSAASGNSSR